MFNTRKPKWPSWLKQDEIDTLKQFGLKPTTKLKTLLQVIVKLIKHTEFDVHREDFDL